MKNEGVVNNKKWKIKIINHTYYKYLFKLIDYNNYRLLFSCLLNKVDL